MKHDPGDPNQASFLGQSFRESLDPKRPLRKLADRIPWDHFEVAFADRYDVRGRKAKPIRLMVGLLILKHLENLSDEVLIERWTENPYYQYFCGMEHFHWEVPCHPTDLIKFRQRIGAEGCEEILKVSVLMQPKADRRADVVVLDTTVQEKNITHPRDAKLYQQVHRRCRKIALAERLRLRRTYAKEVRKLRNDLKTRNFPRAHRKAKRATKRLRTIAGAVMRDCQRQLHRAGISVYDGEFAIMERILTQQTKDSDKIYSLHEPDVYCMGKGKDHKQYEFGSKVSIAMSLDGVIVGAMNFLTNRYDGHTVEDACEQIERLNDTRVRMVIGDKGYRGKDTADAPTRVITPDVLSKKRISDEDRSFFKKLLCRRTAIEPVIGHLKSDHRLGRNYLRRWIGDEINVVLAASAWNFRRLMRLLKSLRPIFEAWRWVRAVHSVIAGLWIELANPNLPGWTADRPLPAA